ncbi:thiamine pyrophosphate-binding protein [Enterococcus faecium]|uniref:thiamine pyrophosphate-binding protein n=1 Tax=Enterococcus faecium TaxID=1352 RepID=UPI003CC5B745
MKNSFYTTERNAQIVVSLMKAHNVKRIVVSPGMKNMCLVASLQADPFFELYSCVDERSAAYIACGLAEETGEPVALSCTGATASRNYTPALTEAYYSKIPILAITSMSHVGDIGQLVPQTIDRRTQFNDLVKMSVQLPMIRCQKDEQAAIVHVNSALLELRRHGGGPVHINMETLNSRDFSVTELPPARVIRRIERMDKAPKLEGERVGVFVGAHRKWSPKLTKAVDKFCEEHNAVVFCDHTSNYHGKYGVWPYIVTTQSNYNSELKKIDTLIHIGEISGAYIDLEPKQVWRVNTDGEIRDLFRKMTYVFETDEVSFFEEYISIDEDIEKNIEFYLNWKKEVESLRSAVPDIPFSNAWVAQNMLPMLPDDSSLLVGILNSLRNWNFFEAGKSITGYSNTGGFGIDGLCSTVIGISLANAQKLCFAVVGDLAFFYDLNSLGNRHVGNNVRIMLINNGMGVEFRNYSHPCSAFGDDANQFMAGAGHFGDQSTILVKNYAESLGYKYLSASNKAEFKACADEFCSSEIGDRPIIFEVFTKQEDEYTALEKISNLVVPAGNGVKQAVKKVIGDKGMGTLKKFLGK